MPVTRPADLRFFSGQRSDSRLFCHVYGRGARARDQFVPGWPYSFVAALETGRTSWVALLDAARLGPADDATAVTAAQLPSVVELLIQAGQWKPGDPEILIVMDSGSDVAYLSHVLADLPPTLLGRLRSDRVMLRDPGPARSGPRGGPPRRHGGVLALARPDTLMKQTLGWTRPKIRRADTADLWTWLVIAAHTQLRLARPVAEDLRRPWEHPAPARRLTPARVSEPAHDRGPSGSRP